jgi:hypothetical protein
MRSEHTLRSSALSSHPEPPQFLKAQIRNLGGNVAWLSAQPSYQAFFHKAYCRMIGKDIPIEKVWAQPKRSPSTNQKVTSKSGTGGHFAGL